GTILQVRLLARNLRQRRFTARLVQLLEPIEAVSTEPKYLTRLRHAIQRLRQLQQSNFVLDNLLFLRHLTSPGCTSRTRIMSDQVVAITRHGGRASFFQWQPWLRAIERLHLALLIAAQHQRML